MDKINFKTDDKNINDLINQIKNKSGRDIEICYGEMTIGANETLTASIESGISKITVKNNYKFTEEEIYHELFHLFIKLENGIHATNFNGDLSDFLKRNIQQSMLVLQKVHSIFHHSYFFQKMINNKFSPGKDLENQLMNCIDRYKDIYLFDRDIHNILDVWNISLSTEDKNLNTKLCLEKLKDFNQNNYNKGIKLLEISKSFINPNKEPDVFCNILKELLNYTNDIKYSKNNLLVIYE